MFLNISQAPGWWYWGALACIACWWVWNCCIILINLINCKYSYLVTDYMVLLKLVSEAVWCFLNSNLQISQLSISNAECTKLHIPALCWRLYCQHLEANDLLKALSCSVLILLLSIWTFILLFQIAGKFLLKTSCSFREKKEYSNFLCFI